MGPLLDHRPGMAQGMEPALIQTFIPELAVEVSDEHVLRGSPTGKVCAMRLCGMAHCRRVCGDAMKGESLR